MLTTTALETQVNNGQGYGNMPGPGNPGGSAGMPWPGAPDDHTWLIVLGQVLHFVIVLLALATILLALRMWFRSRTPHVVPSAALTELQVRYARGEVTREEYLARRDDLEHTAP